MPRKRNCNRMQIVRDNYECHHLFLSRLVLILNPEFLLNAPQVLLNLIHPVHKGICCLAPLNVVKGHPSRENELPINKPDEGQKDEDRKSTRLNSSNG